MILIYCKGVNKNMSKRDIPKWKDFFCIFGSQAYFWSMLRCREQYHFIKLSESTETLDITLYVLEVTLQTCVQEN